MPSPSYPGTRRDLSPPGTTPYTCGRAPPPASDDIPQERTLSSNGISITSRFYYPPLPKGLTAWELGGANTAPLKRWEQTTIKGLTTEPIVLKGYYSQTFRPEHHNLTEHFLFEPRLEPGISIAILSQLREQEHPVHPHDPRQGPGGAGHLADRHLRLRRAVKPQIRRRVLPQSCRTPEHAGKPG